MQAHTTLPLAERYQAIQISIALERLLLLANIRNSYLNDNAPDATSDAEILKLAASEAKDILSRSNEQVKWLQKQLGNNSSTFEAVFAELKNDHAPINGDAWDRFQSFVAKKGGILGYFNECADQLLKFHEAGKLANAPLSGATAQAAAEDSGAATCFFIGVGLAVAFASANLWYISGALAAASKEGCFNDP